MLLRALTRSHAHARPYSPLQLGDLPTLVAKPHMRVAEAVKGTRENAVCSNRGYCDEKTGLCQCLEGFAGSDANESRGLRRDCGYKDPHGITQNPYYQ